MMFEQYEFAGPFSNLEDLDKSPGVFIILCSEEGKFRILQVGCAKEIRVAVFEAIQNSEFSTLCKGKLRVAVYDTVDEDLMNKIKHQIQLRHLLLT